MVVNDLYDGQTIDARRESKAWLQPGFSDDSWTGVHQSKLDFTTLTPYIGPPVRRQEELQPIEIWTSPAGRTLVDFGQNLVGWLRARVQGPAGSTITLRHAEVLEHDELGTRPLRTAKATDHFILSGREDVFEPTFTFHGFRYVEVDGWPGELTTDAITAVVVSSELRRIGEFECSDELLNQLHRNVVWGTRGNFLDVPTDCPQRDERLGWTGDIAVFAPVCGLPLRRRGLSPRMVGQRRRRAAGSRRHGGLRRAGRLEIRQTSIALSISGKHRNLERRGRVGAMGPVACVRESAGTA